MGRRRSVRSLADGVGGPARTSRRPPTRWSGPREADEVAFDRELFEFYRRAIALRREQRRAAARQLERRGERRRGAVLRVSTRTLGDEQALVAFNRGEKDFRWTLPEDAPADLEVALATEGDADDVDRRRRRRRRSIDRSRPLGRGADEPMRRTRGASSPTSRWAASPCSRLLPVCCSSRAAARGTTRRVVDLWHQMRPEDRVSPGRADRGLRARASRASPCGRSTRKPRSCAAGWCRRCSPIAGRR